MSLLDKSSPEDIKRGLARLNGALQDLRKVEEVYQRAQQRYEMFHTWLSQRAAFSFDTTTGLYKLDETDGKEQQVE